MKPTLKTLLICLIAFLTVSSCKKDEPKSYTLTLTESPVNSGTLTGGGIYQSGKQVNLTATANSDYNFVNWTKGANEISTNPNFTYTTTVEDVTLTANFAVKTYALTVTVNPINTGTVNGGGNYPSGQSVDLTATPNSGYAFANWKNGDAVVSTNANYTYTTTAEAVTLTANFVQSSYTLSVSVNLANSGTVDGGGSYLSGASANLTATPNIGYTFISWKKGDNVVSTSANFTYTTQAADETLTAVFSEKNYNITLGAQANTTIGGFYSIARENVYTLVNASTRQDSVDLLCFYEHDVANNRINDITLSSPGANTTGIFGGTSTDPSNWTTKRLTLFTAPATSITTTQFDALHQNDPAIQSYFNTGVTSGNKKAKTLAVDNIYAFKTTDNVYGLFKVTSVVQGADGSVQVILKLRK